MEIGHTPRVLQRLPRRVGELGVGLDVDVARDVGRHEQLQLDHEDLDDKVRKGRPSLEAAQSAPGIDYGALDEDVVEKLRLSSDGAGELEVGDCLSSVRGTLSS